MFTRFFIDRPIFAAVLSIVIVLAGGIAVWTLPIAQYPQIAPPTVQVDCNYPGASAQVVAESIAAPIEQQVNGVEDMLYMNSQCTNDGSYTLTVTFKLGTNLDLANVLVQNRVNLALPQLPDVVKQTGVSTRKRSPDILLVASIYSPDGSRDQLYLSNYAVLHMRDEIARLPGISECFVFGVRDYSMRIWVDPERMAARDLSATDVAAALREQNFQVAAGQVGQPPAPESQSSQFVVTTTGRLTEPSEFEDVVVKRGRNGQVVRIKDIGRVEINARNQDINNRFNGKPAVGLAIFQLPDSNALETAELVRQKVDELSKDFPEGVACEIGYDTTPFIRESIAEVFKSLRDAIILVALVVLVFLQSWRSAIIPLVAVPVAIVGTFAVMAAAGFSLNNLTLFGLVLAIGIVVDDAIVVVEAVEHHIEHGLPPRAAAIKAMQEVSGPVIAVGLVLSAVFIPCAFIGGIIGQFFRQFALTIAISTLLSAFNSLTLSPALAAILLKPKKKGRLDWGTIVLFALLGALAAPVLRSVYHVGESWPALTFYLAWVPVGTAAGLLLYFGFNPAFAFLTRGYTFAVGKTLRLSLVVLVVYGGLLYVTYWGFGRLPTGFIPSQDKGYAIASIQLPDAAASGRTRRAISEIEKIILAEKGVAYTTSVAGNSFVLSAYGSNFGSMFIIFKPFDERARIEKELRQKAESDPRDGLDADEYARLRKQRAADESDEEILGSLTDEEVDQVRGMRRDAAGMNADQILARLRKELADKVPEADVALFGPPPVSGLGRAGGFRVMIEDRGDLGPRELEKQTLNMAEKIRELRLGPPEERMPDPKEAGESDVDWAAERLKSDNVRRRGQATRFLNEVSNKARDIPTRARAKEALARAKVDPKDATREDIARAADDLKGGNAQLRGPAAKLLAEAESKAADAAGREAAEKAVRQAIGDGDLDRDKKLVPKKEAAAFQGAFTVFRADAPQLYVNVNRKECLQQGIELSEVFQTMQIYLGSRYVNDFNRFGRTWQVVVQADSRYRSDIEGVKRLKVRSRSGKMVPLGAIAEVKEVTGPLVLTRYNMYPAAAINGTAADGVSSGEAMAMIENLADEELPPNMSIEWTEIFYLEKLSGSTGLVVFAFSVLFVFLVLAAQYESWSLPLAVILVVPMCVLSSLAGVAMARHDINVFTQVGFVVLIGLACKNAILIVEFAKLKREEGLSARDAALEACRLRLRPILMTSFAFILGVVPLVLAHGAGAEMRQVLGTAVFAGMLGVTLFGIFLTPVFFFVVDSVAQLKMFDSPLMRAVSLGAVWGARVLLLLILLSFAGRVAYVMLGGR